MYRLFSRQLCAKAASSLTGAITKLQSASPTAAQWVEVSSLLPAAVTLREVDTVLAHCIWLCRQLLYPSQVEQWTALVAATTWSDTECSSVQAFDHRLTRSDRELLALTNGVVPLTRRRRCSSGKALAVIVQHFAQWLQALPEEKRSEAVDALLPSIVKVWKENAATIQQQSLERVFLALMESGAQGESLGAMLHSFAEWDSEGHGRGRGATAAVHCVAKLIHLSALPFAVCLGLAHIALTAVRNAPFCSLPKNEVLPPVKEVQYIVDWLSRSLQQNTNDGNPLELHGDAESAMRMVADAALWRSNTPHRTHTAQLEELDRLLQFYPTSMQWEHDRIQLLDRRLSQATQQTESGSHIPDEVLDQMVNALHRMVDLKPRAQADFDKESVQWYHEAHRMVLRRLCGTKRSEWISEAYRLLTAHKYHHLVIDAAMAKPLLEALAQSGDSRVFNLVDLITLYCGKKIDFETIELMFQSCRVSQDYHRARALLTLLQETIPGFLAKAPAAVSQALVELKILPEPPKSLFEVGAVPTPIADQRR